MRPTFSHLKKKAGRKRTTTAEGWNVVVNTLLFVLRSRLLTNVVPVHTSARVGLVLNSNLAQHQQRILHLGVLLLPVLAAEVVEPLDLVQDDIDNSNKNGHTNRVTPHKHDRDKIGPAIGRVHEDILGNSAHDTTTAARQPAKDGEDGGQDIDDEDGAHELPRGPGLAATGDEDEPVLSERNLKEKNFLDRAVVLNDTAVGQEHCTADDPGTESEQSAEDDTDDPNLAQLPFDGAGLDVSIVVSNGDGGQVGKEGNKDDKIRADSLVEDDHRGGQVDLEVETQGNTVLNVCLHALEDLTSRLDGQNDRAETGGKENNVGGGLGSLG